MQHTIGIEAATQIIKGIRDLIAEDHRIGINDDPIGAAIQKAVTALGTASEWLTEADQLEQDEWEAISRQAAEQAFNAAFGPEGASR